MLALVTIIEGGESLKVLPFLILGTVLGTAYIICGGMLSNMVHRVFRISADDDPKNIPPRIYLQIILMLLALFGMGLWCVMASWA